MNLRNVFAELKRRNVYRVAAAYAVVAWLLIQIATQTFPFFQIPNWATRLIILALVFGFPIALIIAWAFELTPEGIKRTDEVVPRDSIARTTGRKIDFLIIGVLVVVIAVLVYQRRALPADKSIAVLPLENLSDDKENAFLADGIQDDLLTNLARIKDLKVISRTSVMKYRGAAARDIREIGKALGAANILEGSVRRAGDRITVNVQLIDARTDHHLWAERYDRKIADSIGIQGDVAKEIVEALRATLTPEEKLLVETKPTANPDAYVLFLRAREREMSTDTLLEDYKIAERLYAQAIALDPRFAQAHARLATTRAAIYHFHDPVESWKAKVRAGAEESLRLQPNLGEGHVALALYHYWMERDYGPALKELATAERLLPNDSNVKAVTAAILRRQGQWRDALATYKKIESLDPQNQNVVRNLVITHNALRQWDESQKAADRLEALAPESISARIQAAYVGFWRTGTTEKLHRVLAEMPPGTDPDGVVTAGRWDTGMIDRDFEAARRAVDSCQLEAVSYFNEEPTPKAFLSGCIALAQGDAPAAEALFETVRLQFAKGVEQAPESAERHANLGMVCAFLGRKEEALSEGRRAVELLPESVDAFDGAIMNCYLALIYARTGEHDLALSLLERLITTPGAVDTLNYSVTQPDLRNRWEWDPLRGDPRFEKLVSAGGRPNSSSGAP